MLLTGTFLRVLDDKQRFAIPKRLREALGFPGHTILYLAPGTDGSLVLYTAAAFSRLAEQLDQGPPNRSDVRAFSRLFYAQAQRVELDRQARVRIPPELFSLASLAREIVLLGVRDHLEVWDRDRWKVYQLQMQSQYDKIAETAFAENVNSNQKSPEMPRYLEIADTDDRPILPK